jgi:DNA primase
VATCGTALTEEHVKLMARFATRIVLAFDPDSAGTSAAERFYEWEQKYKLDVFVAGLPAGVDPADLARRDPDALRRAVDTATTFLGFRVARALASADTTTPEGRARGAEAALTVVREHPSDLVRDQYLMQIANQCRIDIETLRSRLRGASRPLTAPRPAVARLHPHADGGPELEALRLLVHRWDEMAPWMHECLFTDPVHVAAFRALGATTSIHEAIEVAEPGAAELLVRLAVEDHDADPVVEAGHLIAEVATRVLRQLEADVHRSGDLASAPTIAWLKTRIDATRQPETGPDSASELLGWLATRDEERASGS